MHVLQVTNDYPPYIGGMATHAEQLARALAGCGCRVTVLTGAQMLAQRRRFQFQNVTHREGNLTVVQLGAYITRRRRQVWSRVERMLQALTSPDEQQVVHVQELHAPALVQRMTALPIVWTNHSSRFLAEFDALAHAELKRQADACEWVTAPSPELAEKVAELGFPRERITYIPNGVDVEAYKADPEDRIRQRGRLRLRPERCALLAARRFVRKNGLHVLLEAVARLPIRLKVKLTVLLAGDGGTRDAYATELRQTIAGLQSSGWDIRNLGPVPNSEMIHLYHAADVALLPSFMEATSIAGLEAMACGLPIIGTRVGGIPEIVLDERTGLLCDAGDATALARHVETLVEMPERRLNLGASARQRAAEAFAWPRIAREYIGVYEKATMAVAA